MSVLKSALEKGFKLPEIKTGLFYSVLRTWLIADKGVNLSVFESRITPGMYWYTLSNKEGSKTFNSNPVYCRRVDALNSATDKAVEEFI